MTGSDEPPPEVPPGIDPGVQSKIDALFARASMANSTRRVVERTANNDAAVSSSDAATALPRDIINARTSNRRLLPSNESSVKYPQSEGKMREESDEGIWHERAPWAPPPLPRPQALARFDDPSKVRRSGTSTRQIILDVLPPTHAIPIPSSPPPSPSTLFNQAVTYIGNYFTASPDIIEYADAEIRRKTHVCIEAQEWVSPSTKPEDKIVRVIAILTDNVSPTGTDEGRREVVERPVEIRAKHKRVREILKGKGCYVAEEFYKKEIRVALKRLKE